MTEDEMVGCHNRLNGHEFEQALGVGDGQGSLACCSPWGHKESDRTEATEYKHSSVKFSCSAGWNSFQLQGLRHARLPCPSPTSRTCSNSCPSSQQCHPTISSSVVPFSSCLQSFPASGSFPRSQFFASGGQRIGVSASASVFPMNIHG